MTTAKDKYREKSREFVKSYKSLLIKFGQSEGNYLSQLISYHDMLETEHIIEDDQSFFYSSRLIENSTGLSEHQQSSVLSKFKELGIILVDRKGLPARNYYIIDYDRLDSIMEGEHGKTCVANTKDLCSEHERLINKTKFSKTNPTDKLIPSELDLSVISTPQNGVLEPVEPIFTPVLKKRLDYSPIVMEPKYRPRYPKDVLDIINYWNMTPGLPHHKFPPMIGGKLGPPTKMFVNIVETIEKLFKGTYYATVGLTQHNRIYSKEEILKVIDKYKLVALNPDYLPQNKAVFKNVGLDAFFYNLYASFVPSYFIKYLNEEPEHVGNSITPQTEKNPQLTQWLKEAYVNKVLSGQSREFNRMELNKFILGANQLHDTIRRFHGKLNMLTRPIEWANSVIDSLVDKWGVSEIQIGHISSPFTYSEILIRYMRRKGRIG